MNPVLRAIIIIVAVVAITIAHYATPMQAGPVHEILQRVYYVPIVLAGLWFGIRGGLLTAFVIAIAFLPHAFHGWHSPGTFFFRVLEIIMFHVIGGLTGYLASRLQRALQAEKKNREEKETAYEQLRVKTNELFQAEEQLRRSDRLAALGRLSAGLAHEIRNPLGSIKTSLEFLREQHPAPVDPNTPDFHAILLDETERLNRILNNFLEFARQEKMQTDEPQACNAAEVIARTADLLRPKLESQRIRILINIKTPNLSVAISEASLHQVLLNLMLNAADSVANDGSIHVEAREEGSTVLIAVEDTGPGVPPEMADRIFDPFFTTKETGTGLGLSIVDRIITSHGGQIQLDRTRTPLSRFVMTLPRPETAG